MVKWLKGKKVRFFGREGKREREKEGKRERGKERKRERGTFSPSYFPSLFSLPLILHPFTILQKSFIFTFLPKTVAFLY